MKPLFSAVFSGVTYLLHPQVLGTVQEDIKPNLLLPVTLLTTEEIQSPDLETLLKRFETYDDVYSSAFAFTLVEKPARSTSSTAHPPASGAQDHTFNLVVSHSGASPVGSQESPFANLPSGPYILHGQQLHQAYRIYHDDLDAFSVGIVPEKHDNSDLFLDLSQTHSHPSHKPIAVPSRLYFPAPSIRKPLSGMRFSVPEDFAVSGLPTTLSSNNWTSLHPDSASKHSDYVSLLLDQGAVLVGRTKDGQFAAGREWTDTEPPVNPRGDGKQLPGGSAAGADSALAGYTWLESSISQGALDGTLSQAAAYGVFALRTTAGTASQTGIQMSSPKFSSLGIASRSLDELVRLVAPAFKLPWKATPQPKRVIHLTDFHSLLSDKQQSLMKEFVAAVEKRLETKAESISLAEEWAKHAPHEAGKQTLDEFLGSSTYDAFCADFYHNYGQFRAAFDDKFGKHPFTEPTVKEEWELGAKVGPDAANKLHVFAAWFAKHVAPIAPDSTDKAAVIVPVLSDDEEKLSQFQRLGPEILAPILGTPQISTPFAQIPIQNNKGPAASASSSSPLLLPFSAAIMGTHGDDAMLTLLASDIFAALGWRTHVHVGPRAFPLGNNSRNVADRAAAHNNNNNLLHPSRLSAFGIDSIEL